MEKEYILTVSKSDLLILDSALTNLPYKQVNELINKINSQLTTQLNEFSESVDEVLVKDIKSFKIDKKD